jgi:hypothetical protein
MCFSSDVVRVISEYLPAPIEVQSLCKVVGISKYGGILSNNFNKRFNTFINKYPKNLAKIFERFKILREKCDIILTGSSVLKIFTGDNFECGDFDIFCLNDNKRVSFKIFGNKIYPVFNTFDTERNTLKIYSTSEAKIHGNVIGRYKVQIINVESKKEYNSTIDYIQDVFDMDCCKICYDGKKVYITDRVYEACITKKINYIFKEDTNYRTSRITKYSDRAYRIKMYVGNLKYYIPKNISSILKGNRFIKTGKGIRFYEYPLFKKLFKTFFFDGEIREMLNKIICPKGDIQITDKAWENLYENIIISLEKYFVFFIKNYKGGKTFLKALTYPLEYHYSVLLHTEEFYELKKKRKLEKFNTKIKRKLIFESESEESNSDESVEEIEDNISIDSDSSEDFKSENIERKIKEQKYESNTEDESDDINLEIFLEKKININFMGYHISSSNYCNKNCSYLVKLFIGKFQSYKPDYNNQYKSIYPFYRGNNLNKLIIYIDNVFGRAIQKVYVNYDKEFFNDYLDSNKIAYFGKEIVLYQNNSSDFPYKEILNIK